jgi:DNA-binding transcriptional ArsR family regulator
MEKNQGPVMDLFGDTARTRIWNFLTLYGASSEYSKSEIARNSYVSWRSFNRVWPSIAKAGLLLERRVGQSKLYRLDMTKSVCQLMVRLADETAFQTVVNSLPIGERLSLEPLPLRIEPRIPISTADSVEFALAKESPVFRQLPDTDLPAWGELS